MPASPFLEELRRATRAAHQALDARSGVDAEVTRDEYIALLRGSLTAVELVEPALLGFTRAGNEPSRAACLRADLVALGAARLDLPEHPPIAELATEAGAVGATYVVEGSALGGMVMSRLVDAALGLEGRAQSYLRYRGDRTGEAWRRCVGELSAWGGTASTERRRSACAAACAVFALYDSALTNAGALRARAPNVG